MPTLKGSYEAVLIYSMTLGEDGIAAISEKFKTLIEQNSIPSKRTNGVSAGWLIRSIRNRRLLCPIQFCQHPDFPAELDRVRKITEGVLRSLIIRNDKK